MPRILVVVVYNAELREFLRSRRARLRPEEIGLAGAAGGAGSRRVPGLRREELAALAGVSVDYYVRLEQGRNLNPSEAVLDAIARALRLDETERSHLFHLARPPAARQRRAPRRPQRVAGATYQLLETLDEAASPALVVGRRMDVLAMNRTSRALLGDFIALPARQRNYARFLFLDDNARDLHLDWATIAAEAVATLRLDAGQHPDDTELSALVGELSVKSTEFRRWWADHRVLIRTAGTKRYHHPVVGDLTLTYQNLKLSDDPEQTVLVYTAPAGSAAHTALRLLAHWNTDTARPANPSEPATASEPVTAGEPRIPGERARPGEDG
ncbi:putative transcriptional regulator [Frankia sp. EI5c]|uniref:helix-turn-helix domain-containing protein n=1 Tax=Frankia sp. EI5c TaxID=683316 RepID=UPI0007C2D5AE|nr:helix-turn-helix transcriptional regulator [Frankia sp. EI5c]OAA19792.1 putative transcriptional regulator [Frankia sp. EI5c]